MTRSNQQNELIFISLGGVGEIGMNLYLYGFGPPGQRHWLMVDLGVTFPGEKEPGVDLIMPDIRFIEEERSNLSGIVLTHAHEDHFGAVMHLWPMLRAPVYATPFTAALLRAKLAQEGLESDIPVTEIFRQTRMDIGPFDIELVDMAHSIPEPNGIMIRTPVGTVFHTGDWKLDPDPIVGPPLDEARIKELGEEGIDTLVCDSTNAMREGVSPSEAEVAETLAEIIDRAEHRVAVTTFASNVARLRSVITAAAQADRHTVVVGRAMLRTLQVARETGHLPADAELLSDEEFGYLPRDKVVALCTGSQGEARGALARIAGGNHPKVNFARGDTVIFSSRTIPGNEKAVSWVQNKLVDIGAEIITDSDALVHCSGHPRRGELEKLYGWAKPKIAIPMHGEPKHLAAHAELARALGVETVIPARNGSLIRLSPGPAGEIDEVPAGRLYKDGHVLLDASSNAIGERRKLSFAGTVSVSLVLSAGGEVEDEPQIAFFGLPESDDDGVPMSEIVFDAVTGALDGIPRPRRKNSGVVGEAVRRAVRANVNQAWGKKPLCAVLVTVL
ncbi:MAG: ribonuclease J [Hyphomicrobiales bacterium]|nr:ribonuclease J [Hyphomicrobiales bacterium]